MAKFVHKYPADNRSQDEAHDKNLNDINRIIHEPARLMIMAHLFVIESCDFLFLMRQTVLSKGNLSSHMSKLEQAGYLKITKEFVDKIPKTLLKLTDQGREAFEDYRQRIQEVFDHFS